MVERGVLVFRHSEVLAAARAHGFFNLRRERGGSSESVFSGFGLWFVVTSKLETKVL